MRVVTNISGMLIVISLIVLINCSIISTHIRDSEVTTGLSSATDYATDKMQDLCADLNFETTTKATAKEQIVDAFCSSLEDVIGTDGDVRVYVADANLETGTFDFIVEETYTYAFKGRKGTARCERVVVFDINS